MFVFKLCGYRRALHVLTHSFPTRVSSDLGIADAYSFLFRYSNALPESIAQAERASLRAVELDPDSAEAHAARGTALTLGGQYPKRSEEHTSELQSLMRISYAVFCLKKKNITTNNTQHTPNY